MRKLKPGDFWRICDRSGFRTPASETVREWTGAIVRRTLSEHRHPQEFIRAKRDDMSVPDPRPQPIDQYSGPLRTEITAESLAGAQTLTVRNTERFLAGDRIGFPDYAGDMHRAVVQAVSDSTTLLMTAVLTGSVPAGGIVVNYTAVSPPVIE